MAALKDEGVEFDKVKVEGLLFDIEARIVRSQILAGEPRIDGRDTRTVRPIEIRNGVLPRTHGSALFTRGETQALVAATLGTDRDAQRIDALAGEFDDRFMLHYNMPPFATGETGRVGTPEAPRDRPRPPGQARADRGAAEQGRLPVHDARGLARSPSRNGSSSMASVCGGCLALMDAGVPMKAHVAGIAMGLIKDGNRFAVLTDILGDEDHLGDMDFKVAGTTDRRHRAADGHQDPGHHQGNHAGRAGAGQGSAPAHPGQDAVKRWAAPRPRSRSSRRACTR